jgi:hypothetical protein
LEGTEKRIEATKLRKLLSEFAFLIKMGIDAELSKSSKLKV